MTSYERKINASFNDDGMPKEGSGSICLSVLLIDFVFKMGKNYYPKVLLENLWMKNANTLSKRKR